MCYYDRGLGARACKLCRQPIVPGEYFYLIGYPSRNVRVGHKICVDHYEIEIGKTSDENEEV